MRITRHSDYAFRVLMYVGANPGRLVTIAEIAERHRISRTHLMKVVNKLVREGYLDAQRGKGGGVSLARDPAGIRVGDVIRRMEPDHEIVECLQGPGRCLIESDCMLKQALKEAVETFYTTLDRYSLQDLVGNPETLKVIRLVSTS